MTGILAIETATEACSVALWRDGHLAERHEVTPRQHSQRLFGMLRELVPGGDLRAQGITAITYGAGPGSFTGLRIAASAVQGLAFATGLPAIPVSTLACQAQTALRLGYVDADTLVCSVLDAKINELYHATYSYSDGLAKQVTAPAVCRPEALTLIEGVSVLIGSGCALSAQFPREVAERIESLHDNVLPHARDLVPLALVALQRGQTQDPSAVQPVYVRDEVSWKKLSEQGKAS
jgi:tRNA threonylcarbamoyladenosine biosynthesis protein TsaB